ncbi:MAG: radical SAM family heme chaperone HemW [Phycisphaerae bacterium]|nr:radical SAM family heme chaperone HemW [Phycisphaerae bacterium]MCZ2400916.1 radical SAM family heme chaperone HemW [Phycisphaerae bacterium]NUQ50906.1 radical SAM family heme chaperone HemW [Phycisphaerae bacterium]
MTTSPTVRALYVHVPYCHTICGYCDFYSEVLDTRAAPRLVRALTAELRAQRSRCRLEPLTIFVGGGTPTTLAPDLLARLLAVLAEPPLGAELEFTVEANPATVSPQVADALASAGVNRVSIGAQSFDPAELRVLERIHRPEQVAQTVRHARAAGIDNINLDLIFAVPGQSLDSWRRSLDAALELEPDHLSCYGLTFEPGTPLHEQMKGGRIRPADPELEADMYEATVATLAAAGLRQYEISNFARPGRECRHNLVYWHNEPYLGIGPSASGFVGGVRYKNVPDTAEYVRCLDEGRSPRAQQETLSPEQRARESVMLELRLVEGIDRRRFAQRFGHDPAELFGDQVRRHAELGLLEIGPATLRLTRRGMLVADSVITDFL